MWVKMVVFNGKKVKGGNGICRKILAKFLIGSGGWCWGGGGFVK